MIATRVIGCKICGYPCAFVGAEIPLDGLCDDCSKRAGHEDCIGGNCHACELQGRDARISVLESAGDAMLDAISHGARVGDNGERAATYWQAVLATTDAWRKVRRQ